MQLIDGDHVTSPTGKPTVKKRLFFLGDRIFFIFAPALRDSG
jgi:hypothetical protein